VGTESIIAALVARCPSLVPSSRVTGEKQTSSDVAAALSAISKTEEQLLRYKYLNDRQVEQELISKLITMMDYPVATKLGGNEYLTSFIHLCLLDFSSPHLCGKCKGRAFIPTISGTLVDCPQCHGIGLRSRSKRGVSRMLGVPYETFRRNWWGAYRELHMLLASMESTAIKKVNNKLN
jgi:hypothetical protein